MGGLYQVWYSKWMDAEWVDQLCVYVAARDAKDACETVEENILGTIKTTNVEEVQPIDFIQKI